MTLLHFAQRLNSISERSALIATIVEFVNDHSVDNIDEKKLKNFIETISDDDFTLFGQNLGFCRNYCSEELDKDSNKNEETYCNKLLKVSQALDELSKIYQSINVSREAQRPQCDESYTLTQQKEVLRELKLQTAQLKTDMVQAKQDIAKANDSLDSKIFSLLTNTVAILGIFVAIAFAGMGITSLFSDLDFAVAFASKENFIRTVFFLFLITFLSYNLLLLLVYFIFRLSRPILASSEVKPEDDQDSNKSKKFMDSVRLTPFLWIDGIILFITILLFVCGLFTCSSDKNKNDSATSDKNPCVDSETTSGETRSSDFGIIFEETQ